MQPDLDPRDGHYRLFPRWFTILELRLPFSEKPSVRVRFERGGGLWTFRELREFQLEVETRKGL